MGKIQNISQFNEDLIKNYNEECDERYFLEVYVQHPEKLHECHNDLPFLPERIKIEKVEKLVINLRDKAEYVIHTRNLKQALNHRLVLKKVHRVIKFNQNSEHIRSKKKQKMNLKKIFLSWWIMQFLEKLLKMWENIEILNLSQQKEGTI